MNPLFKDLRSMFKDGLFDENGPVEADSAPAAVHIQITEAHIVLLSRGRTLRFKAEGREILVKGPKE
jgi:hypothetical protein